ncbi:hypothetical protein OHB25_58235 [Streptomyces mirabilis]|uniref:hypothetical protein n=1 Tax=Streptomyces mirabilis TaxID=68239 RepID=UPI002E1C5E1D
MAERRLTETLRGDVPAALRHLDRAQSIIGAHGAQLGTLHQDRVERTRSSPTSRSRTDRS